MYLKFIFLIMAYLVMGSQSLFAQEIGCFELQPYLDKNKKEVHDKKTCDDMGGDLHSCWIAPKNTCYWVAYPAQCECIQNEGEVCTGALENGAQYGYCKWNDKSGCDIWRYFEGLCNKPGYEIENTPPDIKDYCRLLGGTVTGTECVNFYNNHSERVTCSLQNLGNDSCPDSQTKDLGNAK